MLDEEFGAEFIAETKNFLKERFNAEVKDLRQFFTLIDALIAELYQEGKSHSEIAPYTRIECFILSNNFVGPEDIYSQTYLSKMLVPVYKVSSP